MGASGEYPSSIDVAGLVVFSFVAALFGLGILCYLFVFLYKKLYWTNVSCYCVGDGETPNDTDILTRDASPHAHDTTDESGYVGGDQTSVSVNPTGSSDSDSKSFSPSFQSSGKVHSLSSSASFSQCSIFSVDDETVAFSSTAKTFNKTVSTGVQTDPVTISYDIEHVTGSLEVTDTGGIVHVLDPFTKQYDHDNGSLEALTTEPNQISDRNKGQLNQPLKHFDNFCKLADYYVQLQKQVCPSEPILRPIVDNLLSPSSSSSLVEFPSSSDIATDDPSQSSPLSTKRKWNENDEDEKISSSNKARTAQQRTNNNAAFDNTIIVHGKGKKTLFASPTEENLMRQQRHLAESIHTVDNIWHTRHWEQVNKSLEWIQILGEMLLGESEGFLHSFPENMSLTQYELQHCTSFLQDVQTSSPVGVDKVISLAQKLILLRMPDYGEKFGPVGEHNNNALIIGVDATPYHFGGYCVNLAEKWIQFYIISAKDAPWKILLKHHSDEFEMKNFMLALCIWHGEIEKHKTFSVYTDNNAIVVKNKYGCMVDKLVQHFVKCNDARLCNKNKNVYVNRRKDLDSFAKYIQPADDLSRRQVFKCTEFLCKLYSIGMEKVRGTHEIQVAKNSSRSGYEIKNSFYNQVLHTAREFVYSLERSKCFGAANRSSLLFQDLIKLDTTTSLSTLSLPSIGPQNKRKRKRKPRRKY